MTELTYLQQWSYRLARYRWSKVVRLYRRVVPTGFEEPTPIGLGFTIQQMAVESGATVE